MQGQDFISVAQSLLACPDAPAFARSAISRAYYGAYHYACHTLEKIGFGQTASSKKHDKGQVLSRTRVREVKAAGHKLNDLYDRRRRADYDMQNKAVERRQNALEALDNAREIVKSLGLCANAGIAQQVAEDLRQAGFS